MLEAVKLASAVKIHAAVLEAEEDAAAEKNQQVGYKIRGCGPVLGLHVVALWEGHVVLSFDS